MTAGVRNGLKSGIIKVVKPDPRGRNEAVFTYQFRGALIKFSAGLSGFNPLY